jgi:hypothetical protein
LRAGDIIFKRKPGFKLERGKDLGSKVFRELIVKATGSQLVHVMIATGEGDKVVHASLKPGVSEGKLEEDVEYTVLRPSGSKTGEGILQKAKQYLGKPYGGFLRMWGARKESQEGKVEAEMFCAELASRAIMEANPLVELKPNITPGALYEKLKQDVLRRFEPPDDDEYEDEDEDVPDII